MMTRKLIAVALGGALGVMMAALALTGVLHDGGTAEAQAPPVTYWKVSMPDLGQHSTGWCWAAAAANSFWWYADNVPAQAGLLGPAKAWKAIDPNSTNPVSVCGTVPPAGTWFDSRDVPPPAGDGSAVAGYPTVLSKIAEKTFYDLNQDGIKQVGAEDNYCYNEGVEKWDYLIGLRDYVAAYGGSAPNALKVHDIINPAKCAIGVGYIVNRTVPTMNTRNPCGPGPAPGSGVPGVDQVLRPPTFADYMTELSVGQDVLLWMEGVPAYGTPETAHVVTGVGYNNAAGAGAFGLGTLTISDPWTHVTNPPVPPPSVPAASHNDGLPPLWQPKPDHDTSGNHAALPSTDPYNLCDVKSAAPLQIQCYHEDTGAVQVWNVPDLIFVSPVATSVGGVAELPDVASDSGSSAGTYAALAGGLAAAVVALSAGAWYARRRFSRG
jgi:hypothetical protein